MPFGVILALISLVTTAGSQGVAPTGARPINLPTTSTVCAINVNGTLTCTTVVKPY